MPSLGADMEAGTLAEWRKRPGDRVGRGDIIAEVETDKGIVEVEVFESGTVEALLVAPGTKVPVGTPLAMIRGDGEAPAPAPAPPAPTPAERVPPAVPPESRASAPEPRRAKVTPSARRRAEELGIDPTILVGTGPDGSIVLSDVERAAAARGAPPAGAPPSTAPPPTAGAASEDAKPAMRRAIAAAMSRSKREIPHYYVSHTADVTPALAWLEEYNGKVALPDRVIPAVLFLKAVALSLREFPEFSGHWLDGRFVPGPGCHVGAAVALRGGGLVAPALRDADRASLSELMNRFRDTVTRARSGTLRSSEMSDATITVTSLGDRGTEAVFGVIYPPQVAIVGFGRIVERPWVVDGKVVARSVVHLTLAADHRATDGHRGALFLAAVAQKLMEPERL
jgi:pyruvate dehydrogenase E2 component (dihydrolipoamide acetyltransferase)